MELQVLQWSRAVGLSPALDSMNWNVQPEQDMPGIMEDLPNLAWQCRLNSGARQLPVEAGGGGGL